MSRAATICRTGWSRDRSSRTAALVAFACNRAHQSDIGGGAAGTYNPQATEIFHEGIRLPPLKLVERGVVRDDLWQLLMINTRCPELLDGDLRAMLGATRDRRRASCATVVDELGLDATARAIRRHPRSCRSPPARGDRASCRTASTGAEERYDNDCFERSGDRLAADAHQERRRDDGRLHRHRPADQGIQELVARQHLFRRLCRASRRSSTPTCRATRAPSGRSSIIAPEGTVVNAAAAGAADDVHRVSRARDHAHGLVGARPGGPSAGHRGLGQERISGHARAATPRTPPG